MLDLHRVSDAVWAARLPLLDLTVGLVAGADRVLVVDTGVHRGHGAQLLEACARVGTLLGRSLEPVVVNTHGHLDHWGGNEAFRDAQIWASSDCLDRQLARGEAERAEYLASFPAGAGGRPTPGDLAELAATMLVEAFYVVDLPTPLDLGGLVVELLPAGDAHSAGDLVVAVPGGARRGGGGGVGDGVADGDGGVVLWGDLVEDAPQPALDDPACDPGRWADALEGLLAHPTVARAAAHLPGHGGLLTARDVQAQARWLRTRAQGVAVPAPPGAAKS